MLVKKEKFSLCLFYLHFNFNYDMNNLLQFTMNVRKSHRQTQCTLQLACEDRVLFV